MSKSERIGYRLWFVILVLLTISMGIYLGAVKWLRYWNDQPLMNLDIPLILRVEESLGYDIRLRNTGDYVVTLEDVRLEGEAFTLASGSWSLESQEGRNQIHPYSKVSQDAILQIHLQGYTTANPSTKILVIYRYGWLRQSVVLEIKAELPS